MTDLALAIISMVIIFFGVAAYSIWEQLFNIAASLAKIAKDKP